MLFLISLLNRLAAMLNQLSWLPPLLARITVGTVFMESGWGKLHHLDKVIGFFTGLGLPAPSFQAHLVANTEFACGLLLFGGLGTRLASAPLCIVMTVAILTAKKDDLHGFSDLTGFPEYLYIVLLVWLIVSGAGLLSLDTLLARRMKKSG